MTASSDSADTHASLQQLIVASGHTADRRIGPFTQLATAAQLQRRRVSHVDRVTRSTALWALIDLDENIRKALEAAGIVQTRLAEALSLDRPPDPVAVTDADLHEDFAAAMRAYLPTISVPRPIGLADVAAAILRSVHDDSGGLLPEHLKMLGADLDTALAAIERLLAPDDPEASEPDDFSASIRRVRDDLGRDTPVTPSQIAEALQQAHPEYADGGFGQVTLRPAEGTAASVDHWLGRVHGLYDMAEVAATRHRVIDGELTLAALAELDTALAEDLRRDGVLEVLSAANEVAPRRATLDRTEWATDAPADTDLLGRKRLAEVLAQRVRNLATPGSARSRSFLVHVDGPWGAGKSTLFGFLQQELEPQFIVVSVNAWLEQRVGVQWWTLLSALRREILRSTPWYKRPWAWRGGLTDRIRARWVSFAAAVLVLVAAVVGVVSVADLDLGKSGDAADSILKVISLATAAFAGLVALGRYILPGSRKTAQDLVDASDNPMHQVGRLFARALGRAKKPVVFLIDDLDRCDEGYVVEFLEVVQTLVRDASLFVPRSSGVRKRPAQPGPYIFVAADGRWIRSSYERHYESFAQSALPGRPLGYLFLEKIFQLHVRLPTITASSKQAFLASLLVPSSDPPTERADDTAYTRTTKEAVRNAQTEGEVIQAARMASQIDDAAARLDVLGDAAVKFSNPAIMDATEHALAPFSVFLEPNPRSMKLFVNTYGVLRSLRTLEEVFVPTGPLALWTVVEIRWPYLADYLRVHPDAVEQRTSGTDLPDFVRSLLQDRDVASVLDDRESGPLDATLIRQCAGAA